MGYGYSSSFALLVVLFILLVIIGASYAGKGYGGYGAGGYWMVEAEALSGLKIAR